MKRKTVRVTTRCPANWYAGPQERVVEFSGSKLGGLISFRELPDGGIRVEVYRADKGVIVHAGGQVIPAHYPPDCPEATATAVAPA